jgi:hypothetical protein
VQDRGYDDYDNKHRECNRGKEPYRIPDEQEDECTCDKIVLVGNRPFRPPFSPEPALEEALDQIPEKCPDSQQGDRQEVMIPARIPMKRPRQVFPSPKIRLPSE